MEKKQLIAIIMTFIMFTICVIVPMAYEINSACNHYEITATVTDKGIKNNKGNSKYMIYAKDENGETIVMEITDNFFAGRFDSSDVYAAIETDETYTFTVGGARIPLLSVYPNIYDLSHNA